MDFHNKRIVVISPEFFGIEKKIIEELKRKGSIVTWYDERAVFSSIGRAINSIIPDLFKKKSINYYEGIINELDNDIDMFLIIKGEMVFEQTIKLIKRKFPKSKMILYLWDPVLYVKGIEKRFYLYDKVLSFEPDDCQHYSLEFCPLFCDVDKRSKSDLSFPKYDLCFYGTMHGDRFEVINKLIYECELKKIRLYTFCFLRGKFMCVYYWITHKAFRTKIRKKISYTPKNSLEIVKIINDSKAVFDANDVNQKGLTIRTMETLLSGKKIITTNADIVNYDFYNPRNILVVDRNNIFIDKDFFEKEYREIGKDILHKYTAEGWVENVFN